MSALGDGRKQTLAVSGARRNIDAIGLLERRSMLCDFGRGQIVTGSLTFNNVPNNVRSVSTIFSVVMKWFLATDEPHRVDAQHPSATHRSLGGVSRWRSCGRERFIRSTLALTLSRTHEDNGVRHTSRWSVWH